MSKAFTREDDLPDDPVLRRQTTALPPGAKNYITPAGERQLRNELSRLVQERSELSDDNTKLSALDQRIISIQESLRSAVVVPPPALEQRDQVLFGATVTAREPDGEETRYRIVGVDETDTDRDWVSWLSPIAKALINRRLGERVRFKFPSGEKKLEIVEIAYE